MSDEGVGLSICLVGLWLIVTTCCFLGRHGSKGLGVLTVGEVIVTMWVAVGITLGIIILVVIIALLVVWVS